MANDAKLAPNGKPKGVNPYHAITCPATWTDDRCNCGGWVAERLAMGLPIPKKVRAMINAAKESDK